MIAELGKKKLPYLFEQLIEEVKNRFKFKGIQHTMQHLTLLT